jgi:hypothetical protein
VGYDGEICELYLGCLYMDWGGNLGWVEGVVCFFFWWWGGVVCVVVVGVFGGGVVR